MLKKFVTISLAFASMSMPAMANELTLNWTISPTEKAFQTFDLDYPGPYEMSLGNKSLPDGCEARGLKIEWRPGKSLNVIKVDMSLRRSMNLKCLDKTQLETVLMGRYPFKLSSSDELEEGYSYLTKSGLMVLDDGYGTLEWSVASKTDEAAPKSLGVAK